MASNPLRVLGSAPDHFSLLDLPNELLIEIAQSMGPNDLCRLMQACLRLNNVLAPCLRSCFIQNKDKILYDACTENNITIIRQAIAVGAKPAAKFLLRACARNNIELVTILLDDGKLDVNLSGYQDVFRVYHLNPVSPLQMAIHFCHPAIVEALFSRGAKVNNDPTHYDYLMRAVNSGDITILRLVLEHVETIPVYTGRGWSGHADPVRHAMLNRREMLLPFVERGCHQEHARFSPRTALSFAVYFNCVDTVKLLLENGCDPYYPKFPWNYSPLVECCSRRGNVEIMRALLEAGADPDEDVNFCCQ